MKIHTVKKSFPMGMKDVSLWHENGNWFVSWPEGVGLHTARFSTISKAARYVFVNSKGFPSEIAYKRGTGREVPGVSWNFFCIKNRKEIAPDLISPTEAVKLILDESGIDPGSIDHGTKAFWEHFSERHEGMIKESYLNQTIRERLYVLEKLMIKTLKSVGAGSWRQIVNERTIKGKSPLEYFRSLEGLELIRLPDAVLDRHTEEDYYDFLNDVAMD